MTTIVLVRKKNDVVVASDGQVSMGNTVIKSNANKVRKIEKRNVIAGFAGSTADALTLFERLEAKLEKHAGNLTRAAVELAKDWRTDKYLRRLEALMAIGDKEKSFIISGTGRSASEGPGRCDSERLCLCPWQYFGRNGGGGYAEGHCDQTCSSPYYYERSPRESSWN